MKCVYVVGGILLLGLSACQTVDRGSFGAFKRSLNTTSHGYAVVEDPTGSAPTKSVERFEVRPGDCGSSGGWSDCEKDRERSELGESSKSATRGSSKWYGWSFFVPEDYVNIYPTKVALGQFHQDKSHVVWMFQNASGGYHLDDQVLGSSRMNYKLIDEKDLRGKWHHIEVHAKWAKKDDGFFKVWVNGEQKVDYSGQTMTATATYFKYGIYRSYMSRYKDAKGVDEVPGQVVYYANVRRASEKEGLATPGQ
ncbi:MAG: heparin lyase I family protein [Alphaproteobacteria bacterium]|nr:heparin lyase I family protein [Alphaproteobacteria bacterium]